MRPVDRKYPITLRYNVRYNNYLRQITGLIFHQGIDYGCPNGTPVMAGVDGIINDFGLKRGYGNCVYIKFFIGNQTYRIIHAHLQKIKVNKVGDKITKTDIIGLSDTTGSAQGAHLHTQTEKLTSKGWIVINPDFVVGKV